ncbi:hypothetical protein C2S52_000378 [Perilla frutescens var. hirtella]|nr:hypothetical protein C2S52_000378 [Perilla frutescens var. hirtella]
MDFSPISTQDCFLGSVVWIEDGFCIQEFQNPDQQQSSELHPFVDNLVASPSSSSLHHQIHNQNMEMDCFLQLQNNRLRRSILQEERRQRAVTMQRWESRMKGAMASKDEELGVARNRARELQHLVSAAEVEAAAWEREAREKEAAAAELSRRLNLLVRERERDRSSCDDAASFCGSSSSSSPPKRENDCKLCHAGRSCVVFFPCRHICCCKSCEPFLENCPVCQTVKVERLQVFFD